MAQIAKRAGISKGVIVYYFSSKEALIEQVVTEIYTAAVQAVTPQIAAQPTARLQLQAYIQSAVHSGGLLMRWRPCSRLIQTLIPIHMRRN